MCPVEPIDPDTCATNDPVVDNPVVEAGFAQLWANSNPDAPQAQRSEQAAWIVRNSDGGLDVIPFTEVDYTSCTVTPRMGSFAIPANAIGWIHTHPFAAGEVQTSCEPLRVVSGQPIHGRYSSFPNDRDIAFAASINRSLGRSIDAYTIDKETIRRFVAASATTATSLVRFNRCGY